MKTIHVHHGKAARLSHLNCEFRVDHRVHRRGQKRDFELNTVEIRRQVRHFRVNRDVAGGNGYIVKSVCGLQFLEVTWHLLNSSHRSLAEFTVSYLKIVLPAVHCSEVITNFAAGKFDSVYPPTYARVHPKIGPMFEPSDGREFLC